MSDPSNKRPAHGVLFVDNQPNVIFDTFCTKEKSAWLANDEVHGQLVEVWKHANLWLVGRYVIMPDHIHLFAWATNESIEYENWVRYWKSQFTKLHKQPDHRWQPDHWDTRMRNESVYEEKWNYVKQNPVRAGFVAEEHDWPHQGEVHELRWAHHRVGGGGSRRHNTNNVSAGASTSRVIFSNLPRPVWIDHCSSAHGG